MVISFSVLSMSSSNLNVVFVSNCLELLLVVTKEGEMDVN